MQEIDSYIPYGPEWVKYVSKLRKAKIIEFWAKKGIECQKLKDELVQYKPAPDVPEITVEEFYTNTFNLSFLTPEEIQTIYTATELYARGKVRAALSRYAVEGGMRWVKASEMLPKDEGKYFVNLTTGKAISYFGYQNKKKGIMKFYRSGVIDWYNYPLDNVLEWLYEPPLATTTG